MGESSFARFSAAINSGDSSAAATLVDRFSDHLTHLARQRLPEILSGKVAAEDVVQSAFRSFFRRHALGNVEYKNWESLWTFLAMIVVRKCNRQVERYASQQRSIVREEPLSGIKSRPEGSRAIPGRELTPDEISVQRETLAQLLDSFDGRDQAIVTRLLEGGAVASIAQELRCSRRTVERTLARMRVRLERLLDAEE